MPRHPISTEDFELAAREAPLRIESETGASYQVGNVIFTASSDQPRQDAARTVPATYLLQVAEVLEDVAHARQEGEVS